MEYLKKSRIPGLGEESSNERQHCENAALVDKLTYESILHIFSYLPLQDRKSVRLVCKKWHQWSYSFSLIQKDVFIISGYKNLSRKFNNLSRHTNICLDVLDANFYNWYDFETGKLFWEFYGHSVRSVDITIDGCHFGLLLPIFQFCPNLRSITLVTNDVILRGALSGSFFKGVTFPTLLSLKVRGDPNFLVPLVKYVLNKAPMLKRIAIRCSNRKCIFETDPLYLLEGGSILKLNDIFMRSVTVDDNFVNRIVETFGPQLERLSLLATFKLTELSLRYVANKCTNLKQLVLENCVWANTALFESAFQNLKHLTTLSFNKSPSLTNSSLETLSVLVHLSRLDLTFCRGITDEGVSLVIGKTVRPKIVELRLAFTFITNDLIFEITPFLPNLQILDLSYCSKLTNVSLVPIIKHNRSLKCLSVRKCKKFSLLPLPFFNDLKELVHLNSNSSMEPGVETWGIEYLELPRLKVLNSNCLVPLWLVSKIKRQCPSLKYISRFGSFLMNDIFDQSAMRNDSVCFKYCKSVFGQCCIHKNSELIYFDRLRQTI